MPACLLTEHLAVVSPRFCPSGVNYTVMSMSEPQPASAGRTPTQPNDDSVHVYLDEIGRVPLLSPAREVALAAQFAKARHAATTAPTEAVRTG